MSEYWYKCEYCGQMAVEYNGHADPVHELGSCTVEAETDTKDCELIFLNQKIAELSIRMESFKGTSRYNQIGQEIDNLSMRLAILEGEKDYDYWMNQEKPF